MASGNGKLLSGASRDGIMWHPDCNKISSAMLVAADDDARLSPRSNEELISP